MIPPGVFANDIFRFFHGRSTATTGESLESLQQLEPRDWWIPLTGPLKWFYGRSLEFRVDIMIYPLVNSHITIWKITIFNGKNHYFYGHFQ
jgi:hypothetical protein